MIKQPKQGVWILSGHMRLLIKIFINHPLNKLSYRQDKLNSRPYEYPSSHQPIFIGFFNYIICYEINK